MKVLIYSDSVKKLAELAGYLRSIGCTEYSAVVTAADGIDASKKVGAEKVFAMIGAADRLAADNADTVCKIINDNGFDALFTGAGIEDTTLAGHVAATFDTSAAVNVRKIETEGSSMLLTHMVYGGGANCVERPAEKLAVVCMADGMAEPFNTDAVSTETVEVPFVEPKRSAKIRGVKKLEMSGNGILEAKKVVGIGRGFSCEEDIEYAKKLAEKIGAEIGITRPLSEGEPPLVPNERYIGVSGIQIKPDLYIAVGVSGQTQHVIGVTDSKTIVCINKDANALMFRHSDYGVVGDYKTVIPALIAAIERN